jgi:hypothetical protein
LYGVRSFLADIERGREYWRDGGGPEATASVVSHSLDWLSTAGFRALMDEVGLGWGSPQEYRSRYDMAMIAASARASRIAAGQ